MHCATCTCDDGYETYEPPERRWRHVGGCNERCNEAENTHANAPGGGPLELIAEDVPAHAVAARDRILARVNRGG